MPECSQCHTRKPKSAFYTSKVDSTEYIRGECKECHKDNVKDREKRLKSWLVDYKKKRSCSRCGFEDYRALQFHHLGDKEMGVFEMADQGYALETIRAEIAKCELLCANCHSIEHHQAG